MAQQSQHPDAICKTCKRTFPVNPKHTITKTGKVYAPYHRYPDNSQVCWDNSATIPDYVAKPSDLRPIGERD